MAAACADTRAWALGAQLGSGAVAQSATLVPPLRWPLEPVGAPQPPCPLRVDDQAFPGGDIVGFAPSPAGMGLGEVAQPRPIDVVRPPARTTGDRR